MPGLLAMTPPRKKARVREQDRLVVYLLLTGNASFPSTEYTKIASDAANKFYESTGSLTNALRLAAEFINQTLLDRNMSTSGRGQYAIGWLTLAALRESQCTLLLNGPMHVYWLGQNGARHIHEPGISGKGLGLSQSVTSYYTQATLQPGDRLLFCGKVPPAWESTLNNAVPSSLETTRHRLTTLTGEDLNAVLIQVTEGPGNLTLLQGMASSKAELVIEPTPPLSSTDSLPRVEETESKTGEDSKNEQDLAPLPAHVVQPSAYAIPPEREENSPEPVPSSIASPKPVLSRNSTSRDFPTSIPRARPREPKPKPPAEEKVRPIIKEETKPKQPEAPREPSRRTRQAAKAIVGGMQNVRKINTRLIEGLQKFIPRLLPGTDASASLTISSTALFFIAVLVPFLVVTVASMVYFRYGRSAQYETFLNQANQMRAQISGLSNPVEQRKAWENILLNVERAESFRTTPETIALRKESEENLDQLLGVMRLPFSPVFSSNLGIEISRMAASETDLYLLNAANGEILRAALQDGSFQLDTAFNCAPGVYANTTVGPLVDILAMPPLNAINATVLGIDANGNLLYCAPNQVAQATPLPPPDTNWERVTAFTMDAGNLYVLDAPARAVWVYTGKDGTYIDRPYFFFGGQTPEKQDVIDLLVSGDDLFMLHSDGHLSTCSYSRIETKPTRCTDPATLVNPFVAYQDTDLFGTAHITQMSFTAPPDQSILLLSADDQAVFRITPRSLELQNQIRATTGSTGAGASGPVGAMAVGPNHVLYLALKGLVYFATGMP